MNNLSYKPEYRRNLPHIQPKGATFFVTFRLVDSVPRAVQKRWKEEKDALEQELSRLQDEGERARRRKQFHRQRFSELEQLLDDSKDGEHWLKDPALAQIVCESLHYRDGQVFRLDAYCVMSNHVHALFMPLTEDNEEEAFHALQKIMHSLKRITAIECNKRLRREGGFWDSESFDHYIRDHDEWVRILHYILKNSVKAGIVSDWRDYPFGFCSEEAMKYVTI
jgi:REP element-mobilizing transposase RayT